MSIQKKSLISTLQTAKKANVASAPASHDAIAKSETSRKGMVSARKGLVSARKGLVTARKGLVSARKGMVSARKGLVHPGKK
jgi:hypothetical protein